MAPRKRSADDSGNHYGNASQFSSQHPNPSSGSFEDYMQSRTTPSQGYSQSQNGSSQGRPSKQARTSSGHTATGSSQADPVLIDDDEEESDDNVVDPRERELQYQIYGSMTSKIVGVRYYRGYADVGEFILVRREPQNQYDREYDAMFRQFTVLIAIGNAIQALNLDGQQIG